MSEIVSHSLQQEAPRKLWFEGINRTADAVVIQPTTQQILLIQRGDTGQWALPGGFVDKNESPHDAALREAFEETGIQLSEQGDLVYEGPVEDPRNTPTAWIETSAYLFTPNELHDVEGRDDAQNAKWTALEALPALYGSHEAIVKLALARVGLAYEYRS